MLAEATTAVSNRRSDIITALHQAATITGSDFDYLLSTATRESSLKPQAKASTSSAAGLFQFVGQTWLGLVKNYGAKYGLGSYAGQIQHNSDGSYHADNSADRRAILALRNDPQISALMAGEYANATKTQLQGSLGRHVNNGELYAAHFLGEGAACRLIRMNGSNPNACAANQFPDAAAANRGVFYHANGTPKTVREVYNWTQRVPGVCVPDSGDSAPVSSESASGSSLQFGFPATASALPDYATAQIGVMPTATRGSNAACPIVPMTALSQAPFALTSAVIDMMSKMQTGEPHKATDSEKTHARTSVDLTLS